MKSLLILEHDYVLRVFKPVISRCHIAEADSDIDLRGGAPHQAFANEAQLAAIFDEVPSSLHLQVQWATLQTHLELHHGFVLGKHAAGHFVQSPT